MKPCEFCMQKFNRPDDPIWNCPYCGEQWVSITHMKACLVLIVEEGYEVHLNQQILRHDGEAKDGSNVYVIIDTRKSPVMMKEFKTAVEAVEEWLSTLLRR